MAKNLRQPPPSSSVVRLFDPEAAARAVAQSLPSSDSSNSCLSVSPSAPTTRIVKRELGFCPDTDAAFEHLVQALRRATGARLSASQTLRCIFRVLAPHLRSIELETVRSGPRRMPSNSADDAAERRAFELQLAGCIAAGLRADLPAR